MTKVLGDVLNEKINDGYLGSDDAKIIADNILVNNQEHYINLRNPTYKVDFIK